MLFGAGKDDVAAFAATLPYQAEPEARWNYNSGASNLLARLVRETLGTDEAGMRAFMKRELFDRIGMTTADPRFDAAGNFIGSSHCYCSARDFARFGYLYLRDGVWDGERILPEGWVDYCAHAVAAVGRHLRRALLGHSRQPRALLLQRRLRPAHSHQSRSSTWSSSASGSPRPTRSPPSCATARSWSTSSGRRRDEIEKRPRGCGKPGTVEVAWVREMDGLRRALAA